MSFRARGSIFVNCPRCGREQELRVSVESVKVTQPQQDRTMVVVTPDLVSRSKHLCVQEG